MSNLAFGPSVSQLYSSLSEIAGNVDYIRQAFPADDLPHAEHQRLAHLCAEWEGAIYDVRKEIRNLEDKLGMHPGEEPFDPDIKNSDPRVTMGFINDWLWDEIEALNQTIVDLRPRSGDSDALGSIWLLLTESGVNILNAYSSMQKALGTIDEQLKFDSDFVSNSLKPLNEPEPPAESTKPPTGELSDKQKEVKEFSAAAVRGIVRNLNRITSDPELLKKPRS